MPAAHGRALGTLPISLAREVPAGAISTAADAALDKAAPAARQSRPSQGV